MLWFEPRSWRRFTVVTAVTLALGAGVSCATPSGTALNRFEFSRPEMGLPFRIVLYAPNQETAETAAEAAFDRIHQLNNVFSDYEDDSELSRLSRSSGQGRAIPVSEDLWKVLERSQALASHSGGAFDITVGPYVNLWRRARRQKQLPSAEWMNRARAAVGYEKLRLDPKRHTVQLMVPNMRLDLGGIAKGYAIDEAIKVLRQRGIRSALVAGSGDMAVSDPPPGKQGWRIAIAPLDVTNAPPPTYVLLARRALATSGDVFQNVEIDGKRYSHIVDPKTGCGLTDHSLVTVIAADCTTADSLATTVSVLGPDRGAELVRRTRGAAVHIVRKPGEKIETIESSRFRKFYETAPTRSDK